MTDLLERQLYTVGEAARLLMISSTKLRRWLEGIHDRGSVLPPGDPSRAHRQ